LIDGFEWKLVLLAFMVVINEFDECWIWWWFTGLCGGEDEKWLFGSDLILMDDLILFGNYFTFFK
jgi:hypothetical protein